MARIYTIVSPYTSADDLRLIVHPVDQQDDPLPSEPSGFVLNLITATNWTLTPAVIGPQSCTGNTDNYHDSGGRVNELFLCCNLDRLHWAGILTSTAGSFGLEAGHSVGRWVELNHLVRSCRCRRLQHLRIHSVLLRRSAVWGQLRDSSEPVPGPFIDSNIGPDFP